jgi:hypothetical protein
MRVVKPMLCKSLIGKNIRLKYYFQGNFNLGKLYVCNLNFLTRQKSTAFKSKLLTITTQIHI